MSGSRLTPRDIARGVGAALLLQTAVLVPAFSWFATTYDDDFQFPLHGMALLRANLGMLAFYTVLLAAGLPFAFLLRRWMGNRTGALAGIPGSYAAMFVWVEIASTVPLHPVDLLWMALFAAPAALFWAVGWNVAFRNT